MKKSGIFMTAAKWQKIVGYEQAKNLNESCATCKWLAPSKQHCWRFKFTPHYAMIVDPIGTCTSHQKTTIDINKAFINRNNSVINQLHMEFDDIVKATKLTPADIAKLNIEEV